MNRTTLQIDPVLHAALKARAAHEGRTLTEVIEHVLRRGLAAPEGRRRDSVPIPSYDLGPFWVDPGDRELLGTTPPDPRTAR